MRSLFPLHALLVSPLSKIALCLLSATLLLGHARAVDPEFIGLGVAPNFDPGFDFTRDAMVAGASSDGSVIAGTINGYPSGSNIEKFFAYVYRNGAMTYLPAASGTFGRTTAVAISADGAIVAGSQGVLAVRWVNGGAAQYLGDAGGSTTRAVAAMSAAGDVIAGATTSQSPFRWTSSGGAQVLTLPPDLASTGLVNSGVAGMSADGSIIILTAFRSADGATVPLRWTAAGGVQAMPLLAGCFSATITKIADDGSSVGACYTTGFQATKLAKWDASGQVSELVLPPGYVNANPTISPNGQVIVARVDRSTLEGVKHGALRWVEAAEPEYIDNFAVGGEGIDNDIHTTLSFDGSIMFDGSRLWDAYNGVRPLKQILLEKYGVNTAGHWQLQTGFTGTKRLVVVSGDKLILAGTAYGPAFRDHDDSSTDTDIQPYVARLPLPTATDTLLYAGTMLAKSGAFVPKGTFAEHIQENVASGGSFGATWSASFSITASIAGLDQTTLNAATPIRLFLGDFNFSGKLGDDPAWTPSRHTAKLSTPTGTLTATWTADRVTYKFAASVRSAFYDGSQAEWIAYPYFRNRDPMHPSIAGQRVRLVTQFADRTGNSTMFFGGKSTFRDVTVASVDMAYRLNNVSLSGSIDTTPPAIAFLKPAARAIILPSQVNVVLNSKEALSIQLRVNGGMWQTLEHETDELTGDLKTTFEGLVTLTVGTNILEAKGIDAAGNETALLARTVTYSPVQGIYHGLVGASGGPAGALTVTSGANGSFSGQASIGFNTVRFKGKFDENGQATIVIPRARLSPYTVKLNLTVSTGTNTLSGTLDDGTTTWSLTGRRVLFNAAYNPAPSAGYYTALILSDPGHPESSAPQGSGFATMTVVAAGTVKMVGKLADGTAFSFSGPLDGTSDLSFYLPLRLGASVGGVGGTLSYDGSVNFSGLLSWKRPGKTGALFYPDGFQISPTLNAAPYSPGNVAFGVTPLGFGQGTVTLSGGGLVSALSKQIMLSPPSKLTVTDRGVEGLSLTITNKSGLMTGSFLAPGETKRRSIFGIVQAGLNVGAGYFSGPQTTGSVKLSAPQ